MKKNNNKGFTLAELLIVVAIIAVLVAIAIPVFTSQLEKSKEATDISNIRSYYAEITSALLTGDMKKNGDKVTVGSNQTAELKKDLPTVAGEEFTVVVGMTFKQSIADWQTAEFDIAGVKGGKSVAAADKGVTAWAADHNQVTYTYKLAADGDYYLSKVDPGKSASSGGSGDNTNP